MPLLQRVLVTGGSGFLGSHIVRRLLQSSECEAVVVVSRNPRRQLSDSRISYHHADITDEDAVRELLDSFSPQAIIHTVSPPPKAKEKIQFRVNVTGTQILLRCAIECEAVRAFVYTSSDSAIVPSKGPLTEDRATLYDTASSTFPYGKTKAIADALVLGASCSQLHTATIRIPVIYGEDDHNFVPQLVASIRKNEHRMQVGSDEIALRILLHRQRRVRAYPRRQSASWREAGPSCGWGGFLRLRRRTTTLFRLLSSNV